MSRSRPPYSIPATTDTPALVIYLLDCSRSMNRTSGGRRRMDMVLTALEMVVKRMIRLSTRSFEIWPRYRIALLGYHEKVVDLLGGIQTVKTVAERGIPKPTLEYGTQTAMGFEEVEKLLRFELPGLQDCPPPLVCHLTDGLYGGADPQPIVARIMDLRVPNGNVLVENIFVSKSVLADPVADPFTWPGVTSVEQLGKEYARKLFEMSSVVPDSYLQEIRRWNYQLEPGARMLFPGDAPELVELGFVMSAATQTT